MRYNENAVAIELTVAELCYMAHKSGSIDARRSPRRADPPVKTGELYKKLREKGILVRHFTAERISEFNRITIGTPEDMETFINTVKGLIL